MTCSHVWRLVIAHLGVGGGQTVYACQRPDCTGTRICPPDDTPETV